MNDAPVFFADVGADRMAIEHLAVTRSPGEAAISASTCALYVTRPGSIARDGKAGTNRFRFTGRLGGRKLAVGRQRLSARAGSGAGRTAGFRIKR